LIEDNALIEYMKIDKGLVGIAAEFAVASELGRRNVYAQPTFGHLKRTDLLIMGEKGKLLRIEVKGKQGDQWPNCKGIPNEQSILVLVDFEKKEDTQRPDFYILTVLDWIELTERKLREGKEMNPDGWRNAHMNEENALVFPHQLGKSGKPYIGLGVKAKDVTGFHESWDKIIHLTSGP
jgi:hypothetical protein